MSATAKRRAEIVKALSELSRNGWANARPIDYEPLERELAALDHPGDARRPNLGA